MQRERGDSALFHHKPRGCTVQEARAEYSVKGLKLEDTLNGCLISDSMNLRLELYRILWGRIIVSPGHAR